jgi:hypothetical protein
MFGTLSALAELQRELIVANTRDGLAAARARGRNGGRPPKLDAEQSSSHSSSMTRARGRSSRSRTYSGCLAPTVYGHLDLSSKRKRLTKPSMVASPVAHVGAHVDAGRVPSRHAGAPCACVGLPDTVRLR